MKALVTILFISISSLTFAQSKSYATLKAKFSGAEDVSSVKVGGLVLKTILWMAGESDWADDFGSVKSVRVINIPQREFRERNLSANGFRKVLTNDDFEEVASTYDNGERLTIFMRDYEKSNDLYFLLVENDKDVVGIEIKGKLNPQQIIEDHQKKYTKEI
jgi:hypothetical protein